MLSLLLLLLCVVVCCCVLLLLLSVLPVVACCVCAGVTVAKKTPENKKTSMLFMGTRVAGCLLSPLLLLPLTCNCSTLFSLSPSAPSNCYFAYISKQLLSNWCNILIYAKDLDSSLDLFSTQLNLRCRICNRIDFSNAISITISFCFCPELPHAFTGHDLPFLF